VGCWRSFRCSGWQAIAAEVYTLHVFFCDADDAVAVGLGGEAGGHVFGGVCVGDGVEFWESLADVMLAPGCFI